MYAGQYQYSNRESIEPDATKLSKEKNNRISHSQEHASSEGGQTCMDILKRRLLKLFLPNTPKITRAIYKYDETKASNIKHT